MLWKKAVQCCSKRGFHLEAYQRVLPTNLDENKVKTFPLLNPYRKTVGNENLRKEYNSLCEKRKQILQESNLPEKQFPSVTKVLSESMSQESRDALARWERKMIKELGVDGFKELKKNIFARGRILHENIFHTLQGKEIQITGKIERIWKSIEHVFPKMGQVSLLEKKVSHPYLCYKGIVDCVAHFENKLVVIDWKTSSRTKPSLSDLYDEPLQAAAYVGALNFDNNFDLRIDAIMIVIAYEDGTPADVHSVPNDLCEVYFREYLNRLVKYWKQKK